MASHSALMFTVVVLAIAWLTNGTKSTKRRKRTRRAKHGKR